MKKELTTYAADYLILASACVITIALLSIKRGDVMAQISLIFLFTIFYIFWGAVHHIKDKSFRFKIILEYVIFAGILILSMLTFL